MLQNQVYKSYSTFKKTHANTVPQFNLSISRIMFKVPCTPRFYLFCISKLNIMS